MNKAIVHLGLDNDDKTFEYLEMAYIERDSLLPFIHLSPYFDHLHGDPRWKHLINKIGLKNFDFLYGFPNIKAQALYKRAGYTLSYDMCRYARPVRSYGNLKRKLPSALAKIISLFLDPVIIVYDYFHILNYGFLYRNEYLEIFDERFDRLWGKNAFPKNLLIEKRDSRSLNWRHHQSGQKEFQIFSVSCRKTNELLGYIVFYIEDSVAHIVDFFAYDIRAALKRLLARFLVAVRSSGVNSVSVEFKGIASVGLLLQSLGFQLRDCRAIFYSVNDDLDSELEMLDWFITSSDEDTI